MNDLRTIVAILAGAIVAFPTTGLPADPPLPLKEQATTTTPSADQAGIVYKPPRRGMPGGRVGGGTRSLVESGPVVRVLAPDHVGLTIQEAPSLYWYVSKPVSGTVQFTLIENESLHPILEARLNTPIEAGIQRIRLSEYGVQLATGIPYRWFVSLVVDSDKRSKDIMAGGLIERMSYVEALSINLGTPSISDALRYAEAGLWYDAIAVLSERIEAAPSDPLYRKQRAALLEQVGLTEVAAYDRTDMRK
jgi:hypothetical protein